MARTTPGTPSGRDRVLAAALHLFSHYGFQRITTDQIAQEAGVSQAYAVRAFGSKLGLIRALSSGASRRMADLFLETAPLDTVERRSEFRTRFSALAFESDDMRLLAQLFACGGDEEIGPLAREGFLRMCHLLHDDLKLPIEEVRRILATGMLSITLSALDYPRPSDDIIEYLISGQSTGASQ
ncbi:TetR/AcrR family transcriptional regulator [Bifidobacterium psychraerophilum]|jgi:AcrR family transcriptional regulator|uniref:TetR/AcrR family transcriptional regulator n=2 Tax=Bifidobacterium psychraerophilum TaxID=218140 RepID=UPI0023F1E0A6|nr:TetR/AcrR family transcriptional regulator [Bifidobacterium psychraerophilum]MCI1660017.1 TetR/AcrR family transcriptional regulator [Bifidobacterium psychraerophilum]MCI1804637.1 TetR/AcrR family transcriptional regulator [Bifidobacterium psychraerophilum]MCI2176974.1 TetR/AcrR family transcriptional regulator [Bifidobacterium psychraerophilum]MCI2181816.1 TetR/AcrR family transcriptional regulator [Bifidobacterium psychraerophilum]